MVEENFKVNNSMLKFNKQVDQEQEQGLEEGEISEDDCDAPAPLQKKKQNPLLFQSESREYVIEKIKTSPQRRKEKKELKADQKMHKNQWRNRNSRSPQPNTLQAPLLQPINPPVTQFYEYSPNPMYQYNNQPRYMPQQMPPPQLLQPHMNLPQQNMGYGHPQTQRVMQQGQWNQQMPMKHMGGIQYQRAQASQQNQNQQQQMYGYPPQQQGQQFGKMQPYPQNGNNNSNSNKYPVSGNLNNLNNVNMNVNVNGQYQNGQNSQNTQNNQNNGQNNQNGQHKIAQQQQQQFYGNYREDYAQQQQRQDYAYEQKRKQQQEQQQRDRERQKQIQKQKQKQRNKKFKREKIKKQIQNKATESKQEVQKQAIIDIISILKQIISHSHQGEQIEAEQMTNQLFKVVEEHKVKTKTFQILTLLQCPKLIQKLKQKELQSRLIDQRKKKEAEQIFKKMQKKDPRVRVS